MSFVAWFVFAAFLVYVVWDGVRRTTGSSNLEDYYAAGRRIPWWAAGLSVMATQASAITVIGTTGQGHDEGMGYLHTYLALPFAMILLCVFAVPLYRRLPILTAYEYLERRFDAKTRALASLIFLVSRCAALGIVIQAPSVVLSAMTGMPLVWTILIIGVLTTGYTMLGGVSAVVWTDVKQMSVILIGLAVSFCWLAVDVFDEIGVGGALKAAGAAGKLDALQVVPSHHSLLPRLAGAVAGEPSFWEQKYNVWSGLIGGLFLMLAYFGCDQSQVQRILTNPSADESRKALLLSAFAKVPMQCFVLAIGVLMWLYHVTHDEQLLYQPSALTAAESVANAAEFAPLEARFEAATAERRAALDALVSAPGDAASDPALLQRYREAVREVDGVRTDARKAFADGDADTNYVFPQWILHHLPPVLLGLVIAAIFAAAMSSVDSVLNSLSAATIVDFWRRFVRTDMSARESLAAGRTATLLWGVFATLSALWLVGGGSIIEQINRVGSYFYGSLLGVFVLGLIAPKAPPIAGFLGLVGGMGSVVLVSLTLRIAFLWYNAVGLFGALLVAGIATAVTGPRSARP